MFDQIAPTYDRANRMMSLGLDNRWRRVLLDVLGEVGQGRVVDLGAGTMDLTGMLVRRGAARVEAVDFAGAMLQAGRAKLPPGAPVGLTVADARALPFASSSFDAVVSAFAFRKMTELDQVIHECRRVLRPGGRLAVLDAFRPVTLGARVLHASWSRLVVPVIGGAVSGSWSAYRYLPASMRAFLSRGELEELLESSGFAASGRELWPPVVSVIVGTRQDGWSREVG